jgi:MFS family permease
VLHFLWYVSTTLRETAVLTSGQTTAAQASVIILPEISRDLNIPQARQQWVFSSYGLTSGAFLLLWGKLGDVYGRKLLFILGATFTAATSIGTAFSPVEICLYIMRALHGLVCDGQYCRTIIRLIITRHQL